MQVVVVARASAPYYACRTYTSSCRVASERGPVVAVVVIASEVVVVIVVVVVAVVVVVIIAVVVVVVATMVAAVTATVARRNDRHDATLPSSINKVASV